MPLCLAGRVTIDYRLRRTFPVAVNDGTKQVGALDWKLGYQKLDWGNRFLVVGGLRDLTPIDIPALTRPGATHREIR